MMQKMGSSFNEKKSNTMQFINPDNTQKNVVTAKSSAIKLFGYLPVNSEQITIMSKENDKKKDNSSGESISDDINKMNHINFKCKLPSQFIRVGQTSHVDSISRGSPDNDGQSDYIFYQKRNNKNMVSAPSDSQSSIRAMSVKRHSSFNKSRANIKVVKNRNDDKKSILRNMNRDEDPSS